MLFDFRLLLVRMHSHLLWTDSVQLEIVFHTLLPLGLYIEVLEVIPADGLSLILIKSLRFLFNKLMKSILGITQSSLMCLRGHDSQHMVV